MSDTATDIVSTEPNIAAMGPGEAAAKLDALLKQQEFSSKYLGGDGASVKLVNELMARKSNADETERVIAAAGDASVPLPKQGGPNVFGMSAADLRTAVSWLKQDGVHDEFTSRLLRGDTLPPDEYARYATAFRIEKAGSPEWRDRLNRGDAIAKRELVSWMCLVAAQRGAFAPSISGRF